MIASGAISFPGRYNDYRLPTLIADLNCTGGELSFLDCSNINISIRRCSGYNDASITCQRKQIIQENYTYNAHMLH